jgi:hypothetical protein
MARRPEVANLKDVLSRDDLAELQQKLSRMSVTGLQDFYRTAYFRCRLEGERLPQARAIQELVQAWKQMRKWRQHS